MIGQSVKQNLNLLKNKFSYFNCNIAKMEKPYYNSKPKSKLFRKFLLSFDLFGKQVNLQIKNKETLNSLFGTVLSLSIMIFVIYTFVVLSYDLFSQKTPILNYRTEYQRDPELTQLKSDNFQVATIVMDDWGSPIIQTPNETLFLPILSVCNRSAKQENGQMSMTNNCSSFRMVQCSQVKDVQLLKDMGFEKEYLNLSYCIPDDAWQKKIFLQGNSFSSQFQTIAIDIYQCMPNLIENGACAEQSIIEQKLKKGFFAFYIPDRLFNPSELGNPFIIYGKKIITTFDKSIYKHIFARLRHNYIQTIANFFYYFYATTTEFNELLLDKFDEFTQPASDNDLVSLLFYLDDQKICYFRKYGTILDILGNIGGLFSSLVFMIKFIANPISTLLFEIFLINKSKNQNKITPEVGNYFEESSQSIFKFLSDEQSVETLNRLDSQYIRRQEQNLKEKLIGQKFTVLNYLMLKKNIQQKEFQKKVNCIYENFDSVNLIKKIMEIENLKQLLLSPNQIILFENLPRPELFRQKVGINKISSLNQQFRFTTNKKEVTFLGRLKESFEAYRQIKENEQSQIDKQLLQMTDQDLINLFNDAIKFSDNDKIIKNQQNQPNDDEIQLSSKPERIDEQNRMIKSQT